jgi:ABC-type transporter Mla subunit MlaD
MSAPRQHGKKRVPNWLVGLGLVIVIAVALLYAFTKSVPWSNPYEVRAVFSSAQSIRVSSPVRIAGVTVGTVSKVEHLTSAESEDLTAQTGAPSTVSEDENPGEQASVVTMELKDDALPLHSDSTFKIRPRLFLEGNYFVDVSPGSPNADEVDENHTFPVNQTAGTVQLDQVLSTLQGDVRTNLQTFLNQFGNALIKEGGAKGFQELYRSSPPAYKFTSQVNEAFLGTQPGDLGGLIKGLDRVVRGLGRNEAELQDLVTNFRIFSGSFAAEDIALGRAIEELPTTLEAAEPAFANLNSSFPALRAFAREALPGVQSTPATLQAATPFVRQIRELVSEDELRGLVADLRPAIPELADLADESVPFMEQARALSSCFNEVIIPWSHDSVEPVDPANLYPHDPPGRVFEETGYLLTGLTGIGRNGDANGQWGRVLGQSGLNVAEFPSVGSGPDTFSLVPSELLGAMPGPGSSAKTKLTAENPCEQQEPPSLQATMGAAPEQTRISPSSASLSDKEREAMLRAAERYGLTSGESVPSAEGDG